MGRVTQVIRNNSQLERFEKNNLSPVEVYQIFRLAGHDSEHVIEPARRLLEFVDGKCNLLTVPSPLNADLDLDLDLDDNIDAAVLFIAFLAACEGQPVSYHGSVDGGVDVMSEFQFFEFHRVVGTLWALECRG
ncbi:hypothetical protein F5B18DRAFT_653623 [Nemania serpens]|nr:hypothetical protein F5B18DRAFT_653623 [Nemania serpens]